MTDVEKPVWLLDVDGVINSTTPGWGAAPGGSLVWSGADNMSYLLCWAPLLVDRIRALHAGGKVEVRWCTTWCPEAERLEKLWQLPELTRSLSADPMPRGAECWPLKLAAAWEVLNEGRRLIWTDDEALPPPGPEREELTAAGRALLIEPRARRGLQPADLELIETFADGRKPPATRVTGRHRLA